MIKEQFENFKSFGERFDNVACEMLDAKIPYADRMYIDDAYYMFDTNIYIGNLRWHCDNDFYGSISVSFDDIFTELQKREAK